MKKVIIGISGGVDSSVSAYLLKNAGYEVIGITFLFTEDADPKDAIEVCKILNIEHHIIDYKKEFKEQIINQFINDYKTGITPNPCILCNKTVKIKLLYEYMQKYNADYIATGHYAKITSAGLFKSNDMNKDQTYFLSEVPFNILSKLLLPLENIKKDKVREIAREIGLNTADKKDSTDVCFITSKFKDYIIDKIASTPGDIIDLSTMDKMGTHKGLSFYTIGQRRGLNIGGTKNRMYVAGKDLDKNILYVAPASNNDYLTSDKTKVEQMNFISSKRPHKATAKFRYRSEETNVEIEYTDDPNIIYVHYKDITSVTPGQACVLYDNDECLGGGLIKEAYKNDERIWYL